MYLRRCFSCETDSVFRELGSAQSAFAEHAEQEHEVEMRRLKPEGRPSAADDPADASVPASELLDDQ